MKSQTYYSHRLGRTIRRDEGCPFADWPEHWRDRGFALHPGGFPVFLPPDLIDVSNEYAEGDPYAVASNIEGGFQRRRFECTLELVHAALDSKLETPSILDLGCGEGHITAELVRRFPGSRVCGLDYSLSAIERAAGLYPQIDFVVASGYEPPYETESFDAVVCNNIWEHVADPLVLLAAVRRVLRPGGGFVVSTPSRYRLGNLLRVLRGKPIRFMSKLHVTEYTVGQVMEQLRFGGMSVERVLSRRLDESGGSWKRMVFERLLNPLIGTMLRWTGSHHVLESTVFYLARKPRSIG